MLVKIHKPHQDLNPPNIIDRPSDDAFSDLKTPAAPLNNRKINEADQVTLNAAYREGDGLSDQSAKAVLAYLEQKGFQKLTSVGQGGTGLVYLAEQPELGRVVAIKFLNVVALKDTYSRDRFQTEGKILGALHHPRLVTVHEAGIAMPQQMPYLVEEYLPNKALNDSITASAYSPHNIESWAQAVVYHVRLLSHACEGLHHVHKNGFLHCDVKPSNILIGHDGAKLGDFGSCKVNDQKAAGKAVRVGDLIDHLQAVNKPLVDDVCGTPGYIAPELLENRPNSVLSDVYSLGVSLNQIVTGMGPYNATQENPSPPLKSVFTELPENLTPKILSSVLGPEGQRLNASTLYRALDAIALKAANRNPELRYASVEEFRLDLERAIRGDKVEALAETDKGYRLYHAVKPHMKSALTYGAVGLVALASAFFSPFKSSTDKDPNITPDNEVIAKRSK